MKNRTLGIILLALVVFFLLSRFFGSSESRSFKEELVEVDTSKVDRIVMHPREEGSEIFSLNKTETGWNIESESLNVPASNNPVRGLLGQIALIKTKQIVARSEDKWVDYEVGPENGARIEVYDGKKKLTDFVLGRLNFNPQTRAALTYIRLSDEDDTYAVDGFLNMNLSQDPDSYRDRRVVNLNKEDIQTLALSGQHHTPIQLINQNNQWVSNQGILVDSTQMAQYLNRLSRLNGSEFYNENFGALENAVQSLTISANNTLTPIVVNCYAHPADSIAFVVHSSANEHGYFRSDSTGIFKTLVTDLLALSQENNQEN